VDRAGRAVEPGEEPVPGGVEFHPAEPGQLRADPPVVGGQQLSPPRVAEFRRPCRRADDVGKQHGRQHLVRLGCLPRGCFVKEGHHLRQQLRHMSSRGKGLIAVQLQVSRPRDVLGEIAAVFDREPRIAALLHHQRGSADHRQHVTHVDCQIHPLQRL
jgi:hypothetical protein